MFCLADKNSVKVPCTPYTREALVAANLGSKDVVVCQSVSKDEFREVILELLRCIPNSNNSKDLDLISPSIAQCVLNC